MYGIPRRANFVSQLAAVLCGDHFFPLGTRHGPAFRKDNRGDEVKPKDGNQRIQKDIYCFVLLGQDVAFCDFQACKDRQ